MSPMNFLLAILLIIILFKIQKAIIKLIIKVIIMLLILPYVGVALVAISDSFNATSPFMINLANSLTEIGNFFISLSLF